MMICDHDNCDDNDDDDIIMTIAIENKPIRRCELLCWGRIPEADLAILAGHLSPNNNIQQPNIEIDSPNVPCPAL